MRNAVFTLHMAGALAGGIFLVVLGLTGSIMAFEEELDHLTHPRLFSVAPSGTAVTLADLGRRATAAFPGQPITAFGLATRPDLSWSVNTGATTVFMNQYTGEVLGTRSGATWLGQIHQLHLRLLAGNTGKIVVAWAGALTMLLALSGLYLWWPVKRVTLRRGAQGRRLWFDLHNAIGICSIVFLLLLSFTGAVIGFERVTAPLLYRITASQPGRAPVAVTPGAGARVLTADEALAIARRELPGAAPVSINVPGPNAPYRIAMRYPEDRTPGGRSRVFVNQYGGSVLQIESARTTAAGTRLITFNRALHTGDVLGMPTKILMSLGSLALVAQAITGVVMWWKRV